LSLLLTGKKASNLVVSEPLLTKRVNELLLLLLTLSGCYGEPRQEAGTDQQHPDTWRTPLEMLAADYWSWRVSDGN